VRGILLVGTGHLRSSAAPPGPFGEAVQRRHVDAKTIERLVDEAELGVRERKLRGRGRPPIGDKASSAYSVRLPDELVALVDERSAMDGVPRGETIRRTLTGT